jgi:hypothetical protein
VIEGAGSVIAGQLSGFTLGLNAPNFSAKADQYVAFSSPSSAAHPAGRGLPKSIVWRIMC